MKKIYTNFTAEEFLQDAFFTKSLQHPTEETDLFWQMQMEEGLIDEKEFKLATLYLKTIRVENDHISRKDLNSLWVSIEQTNKCLLKKKMRRMFRVMSAACIILFIGLTSLLIQMQQLTSESHIKKIAQTIKPETPSEDVQLLISNKKPILITEEDSNIRYEHTGELLVNEKVITDENNTSQTKTQPEKKTSFSQLVVPNGKRSTLTFSDGTSLWVNAGSRVIYPEKFDPKRREIYVDGEVYLQVSSNKNWPFIVKTQKMDIQVLGTSFNVLAYEEDEAHSVVLVEGEIKIKSDNKQQTVLTPDDLFLYKEGTTEVRKVETTNYTSWINGIYTSKGENISSILDRLSRYYGKEIQYQNDIEGITCTGKLDLKDDLEIILTWLSSTAPVKFKSINDGYFVCSR